MGTHDDGQGIEGPGPMVPLPTLTEDAITRIETAVFDEIASDRRRDAARRRRRRRTWGGVATAAAVVVVAVAISPVVLGGIGGSGDSGGADAPEHAVDQGSGGAVPEGDALSGDGKAGDAQDGADAVREIIATGSATVEVDDILVASEDLTALAQDAGGYVEQLDADEADDGSNDEPTARGHLTLRVPAGALEGLLERLEDVGDVSDTSLSREDVTDQAVNLRARVAATSASVERLRELMSQSGSVSDLIEVETALSERQAQLESYTAQLAGLEDRVAMSSLQVDLTLEAAAEQADPANFGDGLFAGWNGLLITLNGVIVAIGFLLPWLALLALAGGIVWGVLRVVRRRSA